MTIVPAHASRADVNNKLEKYFVFLMHLSSRAAAGEEEEEEEENNVDNPRRT